MDLIAVRVVAAGFALVCITAAPAQQYPTRPIRMHVTTLPGGAPDVVARVVGQKLSEVLGQPVMVDNRPGTCADDDTHLVTERTCI